MADRLVFMAEGDVQAELNEQEGKASGGGGRGDKTSVVPGSGPAPESNQLLVLVGDAGGTPFAIENLFPFFSV